ncbi:hypothetical protein TNCV_4731211 [Trichonephila clavipes]|nr:hypothetical protein TNCV_4731211 [Trichonephila clavipes]
MDEKLKVLLEGMNALKNGQEETRQEMQKGLDDMQKNQEESLEKKIDTVEQKINSVEEKIALKVEEKIDVVIEKIEVVDEKIEKKRVVDLEKQLLVCGDKNESKLLSSFPVPVSSYPAFVTVTASPVSVKLSTYDGKTNREVYKTQF